MSRNVLVVMTDQHAARVAGCYGNPVAQTPHLDALAGRGMVFENAYTPSPICVPSRAALATGRYPHQTRNWDNAAPYTGSEAPSWGARLAEADVGVTTFGKLHYRAPTDPTGFPDQRLPMHIKDGVGDLTQLLRGEQPPTPGLRRIVEEAGPGESDYSAYDRAVTDAAVAWLADPSRTIEPWCAVVSWVSPHYPLIAPPEHFARFEFQDLPAETEEAPADWDRHPAPSEYRSKACLDTPFTEHAVQRARAAYYGLVSFVDEQLGRVLSALHRAGLEDDTTVIYLSDHGESLGAHGLWFKSTMHETSIRIPMILSGPEIRSGSRSSTPVSLVDVFPTVLDAMGLSIGEADQDLPGQSLLQIGNAAEDPDRVIFSEYHAVHSRNASYSVRSGRWKLHHHVGYEPQLFDLLDDPGETLDLAAREDMAPVIRRLTRLLWEIVDADHLDTEVKADQAARLSAIGGPDAALSRTFSAPYTPVDIDVDAASDRYPRA